MDVSMTNHNGLLQPTMPNNDLTISTTTEENMNMKFPIHMACKRGDTKFLEDAVGKVTVQEMTEEDFVYGWAPIHWAAFYGQTSILCGLIRCGIDVNLQTSRFKQTPTHIASFGGHKDAAEALIQLNADVNIQDLMGETALHKAARTGHVDMVIAFMKAGADMTLSNESGHSALDLARNARFEQCVQLLSNPDMLLQVTNGSSLHSAAPLTNGSSGASVSMNGGHHSNGDVVEPFPHRKRSFLENGSACDDITTSSSSAKRMRTMEQADSQISSSHNNYTNSPSHVKRMPDLVMATNKDEKITIPPYLTHDDHFPRPPSPGMDMILHASGDDELSVVNDDDDELLNWGQMHGYGDTAEAMPDFDDYNQGKEDKTSTAVTQKTNGCVRSKLRGVQSRGWSFY